MSTCWRRNVPRPKQNSWYFGRSALSVQIELSYCWNADLWRRNSISLGDQCMKLSRIFVGQSRLLFLFLLYHHLEIISQSVKPTIERLSYVFHDSSISRDRHQLTVTTDPKSDIKIEFTWVREKAVARRAHAKGEGKLDICFSSCLDNF